MKTEIKKRVGVKVTVPKIGISKDVIFEMDTFNDVAQVNFFYESSLVLECYLTANGDYKEEPFGILRKYENLSPVIDILSLKAQKHFNL